MDDNISVEWVEVTIDNDSPYASDYRIELVSPEGTRVTLMQEGTCNRYDCIPYKNWMEGGFRLSTAAMLDEGSKGMWTVEISDRISGNTGTLKSIELQVYGH
jgi:subtilisin-like proprotein convertase family protein